MNAYAVQTTIGDSVWTSTLRWHDRSQAERYAWRCRAPRCLTKIVQLPLLPGEVAWDHAEGEHFLQLCDEVVRD